MQGVGTEAAEGDAVATNSRFHFACTTAFSLLLGISAFAQAAEQPASLHADPRVTAINAEIKRLWLSIQAEIGDPVASQIPECGVIPIGARVCGGPSSHVVYSRRISNEARLKLLADRYTKLEKDLNRISGAASICSIELPPQIILIDGRCRAINRPDTNTPQ